LRGQRAHRLQAPGRVAGEDDDAVLVADERFQAGTLPALFQGSRRTLITATPMILPCSSRPWAR
jgi:hypothetical protein